MPEFLERRFCTRSRYVLSIVSIVTFIVSKIAVGIFAGGVVFGTLLPEMRIGPIDSFWIGSILVIILTGLYTMLGGMRAVAYNDAVQVVVLILGSALLTIYGLNTLGGEQGFSAGWGELRRFCGSDMFDLWKPLVPAGQEATWAPIKEVVDGRIVKQAWYFNGEFPWLGMAICAPVIGLWYWCTDQYIVQRALGAPNEKIAREGSIFAAFLKLFPVYLFIIPGLICFALAKSGKVPGLDQVYDPATGKATAAAQGAFPLMVQHLLPPGLRGIVVAGLLSALMGSLAGVFNACSTLFTVDIYEKLRPQASQGELVRMGRIATAVMVLIAIAWIPVVKGAQGLYNYLQAIQGYLAPPIFVVFFFGVFWQRLNAQGCLWAMVIGFIVGLFRMLVDTPVTLGTIKGYQEGSFLWIVNNINFQYFSILVTLISAAVMVLVSYLTPPPDETQIKGLTFATATAGDKARTRASWSMKDVITSCVVMACIIGAYIYFRG
jgi:SSS family solute:Na+ symporter